MSDGTLFNSGFLGSSFNWWVGQIADDSTWRDNMLPGKFESKDQIPGWGRRYKVRIIGLHDKEESSIPSAQLPWAQVMYPITAGGGQASASQTPNLRQGNFVFGFFLDGQDQQVPVIMGVLGNNAQTALGTVIGTDEANFSAISGYATPANGDKDKNIKVPAEGLVVNKPKSAEQSAECASTPPGVKVNEFGLRPDLPLSKAQFADQQSALREAEARGLTGPNKSAFVQKAVAAGIANRCKEASSPTSPAQPGATRENSDAVHELCAADVGRNDYYSKKTVLMSPCDVPKSALKGMQTTIENLTKDIDKYLNAAQSYIDAVTSKVGDLASLISKAACEIAKYMKIIFDKILEYTLKQINKAMGKAVDKMFPNQRYKYIDVKENVNELIISVFEKITGNLCGLIEGFLNNALKKVLPPVPKDANGNDAPLAPTTPICCVEDLTGSMISANMPMMNSEINKALNSVDAFLSDIQNELSSVTGAVSGITSILGGISGSITSALSFENIMLNIFPFESKPSCPVSDHFTLATGSGSSEEPQLPRFDQIAKAAKIPSIPTLPTEIPFAVPAKNALDVIFSK
jgi:hypothetical protein